LDHRNLIITSRLCDIFSLPETKGQREVLSSL